MKRTEQLLSSASYPTAQMMGNETASRPRGIEITTKTGKRRSPYRHYIKYERRVLPYVLVTRLGEEERQELKHRVRHRFFHARKGWREFADGGSAIAKMARSVVQA